MRRRHAGKQFANRGRSWLATSPRGRWARSRADVARTSRLQPIAMLTASSPFSGEKCHRIRVSSRSRCFADHRHRARPQSAVGLGLSRGRARL